MPLNTYYRIKPLIPRQIQLAMRRAVARSRLKTHAEVWPIDEKAGEPPPNWQGWPDGKRFAFVITHDAETEIGRDRCRDLMRLDQEYGFVSSFNFVPERYDVPQKLRDELTSQGFEVGVHDLRHDGNLFRSRSKFLESAKAINRYLRDWKAVGFRAGSMHRNLDWIHDLDVQYDSSTFDTDPFEPQPDGVGTIFPFWVPSRNGMDGYVEIPYTLPQDFTLFVLMRENGIDIWKRKLDWIAERGGMALILIHPDYISSGNGKSRTEEYPLKLYSEFLQYVRDAYKGEYFNVLPRDLAAYWKKNYVISTNQKQGGSSRKIWIDLDNSPHVPFFKPIMEELGKNGFQVVLTARDCSQTCELADRNEFRYERIGRHFGRNKLAKVFGLLVRALQLVPIALKQKPELAVSHGSRAQVVTSALLGIPSVSIMDYEFVQLVKPTWIILPEVVPAEAIKFDQRRIFKYPGIKEDVYVPSFSPDPAILAELGIDTKDLTITIRPPATDAHYFNPQSEVLFNAVLDHFGRMNGVRMILLPRNRNQEVLIRNKWPELISIGRIIIPEHVVDGLNLIWHSDFVVSGGGTMNREAAALGVPVYSIFRGSIGAVDKYLARNGKLILLESVADIEKKISSVKRIVSPECMKPSNGALDSIVGTLISFMDGKQ